MKKFLFSALLAVSAFSSTQAANLYSSNLGNGLTIPGVAGGLPSGTVRFGIFPDGFDFEANASDFAALDAAFTEVSGFSGDLSVDDNDGFYQVATTYVAGGTYEGVSYDSSIAGKKIYVWVLNSTTPANSTEHAIFSTSQTWVQPDAVVQDSIVSPDSDAPGLQAHIGVLAGGSIIGADLPSHQMGLPAAIASVSLTRTPATAVVNVEESIVFTANVGAATGPFTFKWRRNGQVISTVTDSVNNQFVIPSTTTGDTGTYDVLVSNSESTDVASNTNVLTIGTKPVILTQPQSTVIAEGDTLNLSVDAVGPGTLKFQWKKGAIIPGAESETLTLYNMSLKQAGAYTFTVSNAPGAGTATVTSSKAEVVVVSQVTNTVVVADGAKSAALVALIAGKGATYQWFKEGSATPLADGVEYKGVKTTKLAVLAIGPADAGNYYCQVTVGSTSVNSGIQTLNVVTGQPELDDAALALMPNALLGATYVYQVPVLGGASASPTKYSAKGLPAGLKLDSKTGRITGRPSRVTTTDVTVTFTVSNAKGSDTGTVSIGVDNSADLIGLAGSYVGPISRNVGSSIYGAELGGRFEMTVTTTGAISGKLFLGAMVLPVKGFIEMDGELPSTEFVIVRPSNLPPLYLGIEIDGDLINGYLSSSSESGEPIPGDDVVFDGYRNIYKKKTAEPTEYLGQYNFVIELDEENDDLLTDETLPQGAGYGIFTVAADGRLSVKGKTADGEAYTTSSFLSPSGDVFIYQTLYKTVKKGSILGRLVIDEDKLIEGDASQLRPADPSVKQRTYAAGFDLTEEGLMLISGGAYTYPASKVHLNATANSVTQLSFLRGLEEDAEAAEAAITLLDNFKLTIGTNSGKTKLAINAKTGLITGSFSLADKRSTKFEGVVIPQGNQSVGAGYYLLAEDPSKTSPIFSGVMSLGLPSAPPPPPCHY